MNPRRLSAIVSPVPGTLCAFSNIWEIHKRSPAFQTVRVLGGWAFGIDLGTAYSDKCC